MTDTTPPATGGAPLSSPIPRPPAAKRSADWGIKALLVFGLALLMAIPAYFVLQLVNERSHRADAVVEEISGRQGGSQQLLGAMLAVPYSLPAVDNQPPRGGWYMISPETGRVDAGLTVSLRHRGLFQVPVFRVDHARVRAHFGPLPQTLNLPEGAVPDWTAARIVMGFSDLRGAQSDVTGVIAAGSQSSTLVFNPEGVNLGQPRNADGSPSSGDTSNFGLLSAPATALVQGRQGGDFDSTLAFTGAQRLSVLPFAKTTSVHITGNWPSPSFDGGILPATPQITAQGFEANWTIPFLARGLADQAAAETLSLAALGQRDVGVTMMRQADPYQSVSRAFKYAVMFVGLVFLTFFVFEALSGRRLHPAQYVLIGSAQMIFYLLLLSLSEWIGFDFGFLAAAVATVGLIGLYAGWAFRNRRYQVQALTIFTAVYGLIYLLMRLEDFALLAGSLASFVGLAAAMWLTRNLDWYAGRVDEPKLPASASPSTP